MHRPRTKKPPLVKAVREAELRRLMILHRDARRRLAASSAR
jgi:hypothetical protein